MLDFSYDGRSHLWLFCSMLIMACFQGLQLKVHTPMLALLDTLFSLGILIFLVMALIRQNNSAMAGLLKKTTWAVLGLIIMMIPLAYFETMFSMFGQLQQGAPQIQSIITLLSRNPAEHTFLRYLLFFQIITLSIIGIPGLLQTLAFQKERKKI